MPAVQSEAAAVRKQLEEVLRSRGFARNDRLSRFLRFIVEQHLDGRDPELKESVIGVAVYGRKPGYDTKLDPVVRTEARRLRARLSEYYNGEGAEDAVLIDLPKGGYVPRYELRSNLCKRRPWSQRARHRRQKDSICPRWPWEAWPFSWPLLLGYSSDPHAGCGPCLVRRLTISIYAHALSK